MKTIINQRYPKDDRNSRRIQGETKQQQDKQVERNGTRWPIHARNRECQKSESLTLAGFRESKMRDRNVN